MSSREAHVLFSDTLDVLFRKTLSAFMSPAIEAQLRTVGLDLSKPFEPAYSMPVFDNAIEVVALHGMAHLEKRAALRKIGELQVESFAATFLGRASFQFLKLLSRERFLTRMTKSFRQTNNFIEARVTPRPDGSIAVHINDVGRFPEFIEGVLHAAFAAAGHQATVTEGRRDAVGCEYEIRFS